MYRELQYNENSTPVNNKTTTSYPWNVRPGHGEYIKYIDEYRNESTIGVYDSESQ